MNEKMNDGKDRVFVISSRSGIQVGYRDLANKVHYIAACRNEADAQRVARSIRKVLTFEGLY